MNEIPLKFSKESPQLKDSEVTISLDTENNEDYLVKFIVGLDGIWETIKDFGSSTSYLWKPHKEGNYIILAKIKKKDSNKNFDMVSRCDYTIGTIKKKLINEVTVNKNSFLPGDKLYIKVSSFEENILYRFWIKRNNDWELIKNYSADSSLTWSTKEPGSGEILVEGKLPDSKESYDDFKHIAFKVLSLKKLTITDFKCLTSDLICDNELVFEIEASYDDKRMILYKFVLIDSKGYAKCIQDFSNRRILCFTEKKPGEYKLLCLAKDMYSSREYDDRAVFYYKVKPYKDIVIRSFTTDVSSPQMAGGKVILKALVDGGRSLKYRYIIDGNLSIDSGYIRDNSYTWEAQKPGGYKIELWVKDASSKESYEKRSTMDFTIDENIRESVSILDIIMDKNSVLLVGDTVNIKVIAKGGTELKYSFLVKKEGIPTESISYGSCNYVNFTPEEVGNYELDVLVKDKYSRREYDCHNVIYIDVLEYLPASIDHVLLPIKENYLVGEEINLSVITRNSKEVLIKYILKINEHKIEETEYVPHKKYKFIPKFKGKYEVLIFAKNKKCNTGFDSKKEVWINVFNALPITNTKINCESDHFKVNKSILFNVSASGGEEVLYEFYIYEKGEWNVVQNYSKKNYYGFIPFSKGKYKILVLSKNRYTKLSYEDYDILEFAVD